MPLVAARFATSLDGKTNLMFPGVIRFGSLLSIMTVLLFAILIYYLSTIGWATVLDDVRHPGRTARWLCATPPAPVETSRS